MCYSHYLINVFGNTIRAYRIYLVANKTDSIKQDIGVFPRPGEWPNSNPLYALNDLNYYVASILFPAIRQNMDERLKLFNTH